MFLGKGCTFFPRTHSLVVGNAPNPPDRVNPEPIAVPAKEMTPFHKRISKPDRIIIIREKYFLLERSLYMKENIRNNRVLVKMSDEEKAQLEQMASDCGLPVSAYIRSAVFSKNRTATTKKEPDELPTREVNVSFMLTPKEYDRLNDMCLKAELSKADVIRDCLINGYVITLPFFDREKEIHELTNTMVDLNHNLIKNPAFGELQKSVADLNDKMSQILKQELMSTRRLAKAINQTIRKERDNYANK